MHECNTTVSDRPSLGGDGHAQTVSIAGLIFHYSSPFCEIVKSLGIRLGNLPDALVSLYTVNNIHSSAVATTITSLNGDVSIGVVKHLHRSSHKCTAGAAITSTIFDTNRN